MLFFTDRRKSLLRNVDLEEVRQRVHGLREIRERPVTLTNLFAMVGEEDRVRPAPPPQAPAGIRRVRPDQVP
jgi:hypothetical protein